MSRQIFRTAGRDSDRRRRRSSEFQSRGLRNFEVGGPMVGLRTCERREFPQRSTRRRWPKDRHGACSTTAHALPSVGRQNFRRGKGEREMLKLLKRKVANEAGFTLMELIVVVLIVGILAAVGVPLYLGYVRDSRLAEAKALAGASLTASQACAQNDPAGTTCTLANLAQRIGVTAGTGLSGDGRWAVAITPVTLNVATNQFGGGPLTVAGQAGTNVANMAAGVFINAAGV